MNNDKEGYIVIIVLALIILILVCILINGIKNKVKYEYFKDGQFGISTKCYVNDREQCMCLIDNQFQYVDSYYKK